MANCRNFFLLAKDLFADTAVRNFHSFFFTGSCFYHKHCFCMTQCRNLLLLFQSFSAGCTMASFRFSWCFTGWLYCLICNRFFMTGCRNFFLFLQYFTADKTMTSCRFSCLLAGRCYCRINGFCMAKSRNFFLLFQYFAADGTMTSFRFSWCFTGGGCCLIGYFFCVSGWRNFFLFFQYFAAGLAMAAFGLSGFFAGWSYGFIDHCFMICYRKLFMAVQNFVAGAAVYQGISRFLTGRCFCYHFRFFVSLCRNFLLGFQDLIADLTMTSLSFSCCFTGGFYGLINDFFMSKRWRFFLNSQYFTADCTMASFGFS